MTAEAAQREPTMEEILASIRKIISEDEAAGGEEALDLGALAPEAEAEAPAEPVSEEPVEAAAEPEPAADVSDLSAFEPETPDVPEIAAEPEPVAESAADEDLMFVEPEAEAPAVELEPAPEPAPAPQPPASSGEGIVADAAAQQAAGALGKLMGSMMVSSGNTLDDVVRELLRPMLKEWLDANLPTLVEAEVSRELDRIRRMAR